MKRIFSLLTVLILLCGAASAEFQPTLEINNPVSVDLNGDGADEQIWLQMVGTEEESYLMLVVVGSDGGVNTFTTEIMFNGSAGTADLDGDGTLEIYVTGDTCSDDYFTWCLQYSDEGLKPLEFPHYNRSEFTDDTCESGYGMITALQDGHLTLTGTQDVLGTWFSSRTFALKNGRFEFADDGMFTIENDLSDPDLWDYRCLKLVRPLRAVLDNGKQAELQPGVKFLIEKTDLFTTAYFVTDSGYRGHFEIDRNTADGWGSNIDGVFEAEYFENVPYAD